MSGPYDIFIAAGQSNMMYEYSYDMADAEPGPNLYQYKQDGTITTATQAMDFPGGVIGDRLCSYAVNFCRDYYIPSSLAAGRDVLIIPAALGGAGFATNWSVGQTTYESMVTQINGALAHDVGNVIKAMFWQHGEEDVADAGAGLGNYATMSMTDGYNAYMTSMRSDLHSRITGGFNQVPILVGRIPPDLCYVGLSADGIDHHNSANATMATIQENLPNIITNCGFVDTLNPTKLVTEAETNQYVVQYYLHYSQVSGRHLAHRAWKAYQKLVNSKTVLTATWT